MRLSSKLTTLPSFAGDWHNRRMVISSNLANILFCKCHFAHYTGAVRLVRTDLEFAKSCKYHVTIRQMADIIKWERPELCCFSDHTGLVSHRGWSLRLASCLPEQGRLTQASSSSSTRARQCSASGRWRLSGCQLE